MSTRRLIGPVDTLWLNMDRPNNLMVIDTLMFLGERPDRRRLHAVLRDRLVDRFPVFQQRAVAPALPWGLGHWEDDPGFRLERHVRWVRLPRPGDDATLRRQIEQALCRPLDREHPLWDVTIFTGYGAGAAVFSRFHHALGDGLALAHVLMSLTDSTTQPEPAPGSNEDPAPVNHGLLADLLGAARSGTSALVAAASQWTTPTRAAGQLRRAARTAGILHKLVLHRDPATSLAGEPGPAKTAVWSRPFPLADVKRVGRLADATVNDVLVSALAGAIASYLLEHDGTSPDLTTMVPVNVRPAGRPPPAELGNQFALVFVPLPTGVAAPLARLAETKRRMDAIKGSPEAAITFSLIRAIGRTAKEFERVLVDFFADKAIGVTTNVAGPTAARYLAGARIASVLAWVPSSGRQTIGVCIFTYDGTVRVGFKVDTATVPEPEQLVAAFEESIESLIRLARPPRAHARPRTSPWSTANQPSGAAPQSRQARAIRSRSARVARA